MNSAPAPRVVQRVEGIAVLPFPLRLRRHRERRRLLLRAAADPGRRDKRGPFGVGLSSCSINGRIGKKRERLIGRRKEGDRIDDADSGQMVRACALTNSNPLHHPNLTKDGHWNVFTVGFNWHLTLIAASST